MTTTELCKEIDTCPKVQSIMDRDLPDEIYYAAQIREMCRRCWLEKDIEKREAKGE